MKATGIVRRIDDLGRVVIPKEIRRTLKIREGMPMEIFTDVSGEVILKKYSPVGEMAALAQAYAEALVALTGLAAAVCDGEQVIALAGPSKREALHKGISPSLKNWSREDGNSSPTGRTQCCFPRDWPPRLWPCIRWWPTVTPWGQ